MTFELVEILYQHKMLNWYFAYCFVVEKIVDFTKNVQEPGTLKILLFKG